MPQPTSGDVHVNAPLTNVSVAFIQQTTLYGAHRIFPIVPVAKQSDVYFQYNKEDFLRDEAKPRAPGTESAGGGFNLTTPAYSCRLEALHKDVDDPTRANADAPLNMDRDATQYVTQKMLTRREKRWIDSYFKSGVWGTDLTPTTLWSAATGSTPQEDVETAKLAIQGVTGFAPNVLVLGPNVFSKLRTNDRVRDAFKYTSADSISVAMLAGFFGVERIVQLGAVSTTTVEGAATQTTAFLAGKHALLCYAPPAAGLLQPSAGYVFSWTGLIGAGEGIRIKRFRMEHLASDRIEAEMAYDMKVVSSALGYFFASVVA